MRFNASGPILIVCTLALAACNTINNTKTFTPQVSRSNQAIVYIYRPSAMANIIYSPDLYVNDKFQLSINNGGNTPLSLAPGDHTFELKADKYYSDATHLSLNLRAGNTAYIRVGTSLKIKSALTYQPYQRRFNLTKVDAQRAEKEITKCCMAKNIKPKTDQETKTVKQQTEKGFSVDKTQNPFSH